MKLILIYSKVVYVVYVHSSIASDSSEIEPTIIGQRSGRARLADARAWDLVNSLSYSICISFFRTSNAHVFAQVVFVFDSSL